MAGSGANGQCPGQCVVKGAGFGGGRKQLAALKHSETLIGYLWPLAYWISSTPMASIRPRVRCPSPKVTTRSTVSKTFSHEVWKASAVSSTKAGASSGPEAAYMCRSTYACHRPREFLRRSRLRTSGNRAAAWHIEGRRRTPQGDELETALREFVVAGRRLMAFPTDRGGTLTRPYGRVDTFSVSTESGVLGDKTSERWQRFRIVIS